MKRFAMGTALCILVLLVPVFAAKKQSGTTGNQSVEPGKMTHGAWPAETLNGKIVSVVPADKLVIVQDANGVPFDMRVTRSTRMEAGKQRIKLDGLQADTGKSVSVKFKPERSGDIAQAIQVR